VRSATTTQGVVAFGGIVGVAAVGLAIAAINQREARRRALELATHRRIALDIQESLSLGEILAELCRGAVEDLRFTTAVVLLPGPSGALTCAGASGLSGRHDQPIPLRGGIAEALRSGRIVIVGPDQARAGGELAYLLGDRGYVAFPMASEGLLVVTRAPSGRSPFRARRGGRVRAHELAPLMSLAQQAAVAVANARLHEHVSAIAITDPLTELLNHREFQRVLAAECERQNRYSTLRNAGHHLSVLLIDIDHFKSVNDRYGHPAGDHVLRNVAGALRHAVRSFDLVARYGGEEFAVVLHETDEDAALQVAERARRAVHDVVHDVDGRALRVTISVGVATAPDDGVTPAQLVAAADSALYRSKASGRNRVTHASTVQAGVRSLTRRRAAKRPA
jgi:diguanylate cyclase (GGDEF)-like protein